MIQVTAAILRREGRILVARRKPGSHQEGKWEFPGGKLEAGESPEECLARELHEELGIRVRVGPFVASSVFHYPELTVTLLAYEATHESGELQPVDHDAVRWVRPAELLSIDLAPADIPIAELVARE